MTGLVRFSRNRARALCGVFGCQSGPPEPGVPHTRADLRAETLERCGYSVRLAGWLQDVRPRIRRLVIRVAVTPHRPDDAAAPTGTARSTHDRAQRPPLFSLFVILEEQDHIPRRQNRRLFGSQCEVPESSVMPRELCDLDSAGALLEPGRRLVDVLDADIVDRRPPAL